MIGNKFKFIFIHIPKCGGSSIYKTLAPDISDDINETEHGGWDSQSKIMKQHATAEQIKQLYYPGFHDYFSFTFVRNPWDKSLSDYLWMVNIDDTNRDGSFTDYLTGKNKFSSKLLKQHRRYDHVIHQLDYILDSTESNMVDFIGRFENLQQDFDIICDKIGIYRQELPHKNKTNHKHYTEYYDDETREIVAEKYAKDIEYFGYKFGE